MNDIKVRQAVAYGLDRASVIKQFYYATGRVANEFQPPSLFGWSNKVTKYPYNPTKGKELSLIELQGPCKVDFLVPDGVSRRYMPVPSGTSRRSASGASRLRLPGHGTQRAVASDVRPEGQRGDCRRSQPHRLDR